MKSSYLEDSKANFTEPEPTVKSSRAEDEGRVAEKRRRGGHERDSEQCLQRIPVRDSAHARVTGAPYSRKLSVAAILHLYKMKLLIFVFEQLAP